MINTLEMVQAMERTFTVVLSGYNTFYFIGHRASTRARRIAALTMALVNLALIAHAIQPVLFRYLVPVVFSDPVLGAALELIPMAAAMVITALILRHHMRFPFDKE